MSSIEEGFPLLFLLQDFCKSGFKFSKIYFLYFFSFLIPREYNLVSSFMISSSRLFSCKSLQYFLTFPIKVELQFRIITVKPASYFLFSALMTTLLIDYIAFFLLFLIYCTFFKPQKPLLFIFLYILSNIFKHTALLSSLFILVKALPAICLNPQP